jgi:hypothetical protein
MYSVHRFVNERQPDVVGCLPIHRLYRDPAFSETFLSEEEAERELSAAKK